MDHVRGSHGWSLRSVHFDRCKNQEKGLCYLMDAFIANAAPESAALARPVIDHWYQLFQKHGHVVRINCRQRQANFRKGPCELADVVQESLVSRTGFTLVLKKLREPISQADSSAVARPPTQRFVVQYGSTESRERTKTFSSMSSSRSAIDSNVDFHSFKSTRSVMYPSSVQKVGQPRLSIRAKTCSAGTGSC